MSFLQASVAFLVFMLIASSSNVVFIGVSVRIALFLFFFHLFVFFFAVPWGMATSLLVKMILV